jgi:polysaccharide pyruvyl transferase WcaK-like protein
MKRIGILGHVGNKNLGDEAIIAAVIQGVRRRCDDAQLCGFTTNPGDTTERHGIAAFPIRRGLRTGSSRVTPASAAPVPASGKLKDAIKRVPALYKTLAFLRDVAVALGGGFAEVWFLVRCYRALRGLDLLIVAGSQQLSDNIDGPWAFPYTLFKWSRLARLAGAEVVYLSVGAGPIESPLSRWFVRSALATASYRSYRDASSQRLIAEIGGPAHDPVIPDLVHGLEPGVRAPQVSRSAAVQVVGINPMPFADPRFWHDADPLRYQRYVGTLASFARWLIDRGHDVLLFPTQLRADPPVISDIRSVLKMRGPAGVERRIVETSIESFDDLMAVIATCDIVVPTRFHGIVLAFLLRKPVLGIAYHPKARDLMAQMGQADYVVDVEPLDLAALEDRFIALEADRERSTRQIESHAAACRRALEAQYDTVAALLVDARTRSPLGARGGPRGDGPSATSVSSTS